MDENGDRKRVRTLLRQAGCREGDADGVGFSVRRHRSLAATLTIATRDQNGMSDFFELYRIASLLRSAGYVVRMEDSDATMPMLAVRSISRSP